jgi:hypothetical protein
VALVARDYRYIASPLAGNFFAYMEDVSAFSYRFDENQA